MPSPALAVPLLLVLIATPPALPAQSAREGDSNERAVPQRALRDSTARLRTVEVRGRADRLTGVALSASQGRVGRADLRRRPLVREGEILEAAPGLILTQHSGDGKANQMFARGVNLDHGTDFRTDLESMPLNLPTHGHGQGYTDLNPLIPELVEGLDYRMGPLHAELGDFGSAGGATVHLVRRLPGPTVRVESGAWGFARTVVAGGMRVGAGDLVTGIEGKQYDGPWERAQRLRKSSGMARYTTRLGAGEFSVLALAYANRWRASDQVPRRAVDAGLISRFAQVDSTLGGVAERHSLSLAWRRPLARGDVSVDAFVVRHRFGLHSNFTYFLGDTASGDRIHQSDDRTIGGINAAASRLVMFGGRAHLMRAGVQLRYDHIRTSLSGETSDGIRDTVRADAIGQGSVGAYASLESRWHPVLRSVIGMRGDLHAFDVASDDARNSGSRVAAIGSPKATLVLGPLAGTELYVGGGWGYHSNDARGVTTRIDPRTGSALAGVSPLVRSRSVEVGARIAPMDAVHSTVSLWSLALDSELLFVGDEGTTEARGGSRRRGVTFANFWRPTRALTLDADVSLAHARYANVPSEESRIPGALERVVTGGVSWSAPRGFDMTLRVRHFDAAPLIEDNSVRGDASTLANISAGWTTRGVRLSVSVLNAANARASDVQYYYRSRLRGEPEAGVADVHFHPAEPRQLRVGLAFGAW